MGAIDPSVKRPGGAVNKYPPPIVVVVGGEYDGVDAAGRAGKGAIDPFSKRSVRRAWSDGKSHADGVVLPPQCGGGGVGQRLHQRLGQIAHTPCQSGLNLVQFLGYFGIDNREWSR